MKMKLLLVLHHQRGFHPSHSHHPHPHLLRSLHLLLLLFLHFQKGFTLDCNLEANKCDWRWTNFVKASSLNGSSSSSSSMASEFLLFKPEDVNKEDLVLATLTSPEVNENQSWSKGCSLEFSSNMGHLENASIKVVIKRTSGNVIIPTEIRGTNEQKWEKHSTPIGNLVRPFHIEIIVHRKEGKKLSPLSYLAIGRIQLSHCLTDSTATTEGNMACEMTCQSNQKCIQRHQVCDWYWDCPDGEDERFDCNQLPQSAYCSFSSGTIEDCGWRNQGQNLWTIENGHAGANFKTGSFVASADMHSSSFPPPIYLSWDSKSPYFGTCEVRFSFYLGAQRSSLKVDIIESDEKRLYPDTAVPIFREFLKSTSKEHSMWRRKRVKIPTEIKTSFSVIISATKGIGSALRPPYKRAGFANFSLSKECFGIGMVIDQTTILPPTTTTNGKHIGMVVPNSGFLFTSCNAMGNEVPKTEDCQKAYNGSPSVEVSDEKESPHVGLQKWTVPATGAYSVFAKGADGATGLGYNATGGKGDLIRAVFFWYKNEVIYIVVGQTPFNACRADVTHNCGLVSSLSQGESLNTGDNRATGGGGGGATFLMQKKGDRLEPLLIAAGGGGGGSNKSASGGKARGLISPYIVTDFGKGRGGSWNNSRIELSQGQSLVNGASGGKCGRSLDGFGGFGGGGGSCGGNGGGGGGYIGGRAGKDQNGGEGGSSYVHPTYGSLAHVFFDFDFGPSGFVRILPQKEKCCNGETACVIIGQVIGEGKERTDLETCICSHSYFPEWCTKEAGSYFIILVLCVAAGLLVIFLSIFIFCTTYKNKIRNNGQVRDVACVRGDASTSQLISNSSTDVQLSRLRSGHNIVTEYNPNYEFGGSTCALQDLKEIPRDKLTLVKALGQGAFGEVYQGYLSNMPGEITNELPVAVKTLPEFSANHQAEMDFMTEALIMSKFKDRNIVRFIGVCFEKMPRFIVLELLPGGDLKTFLRESRGTQSKPSPLNMGDLMVIALDVARGCKYLEESHFIHRDIAARNCLLTSKFKSPNANNVITPDGVFNMNDYNNGYNNSGIIVKIADFGMARDIYRADYYRKGGKAMLPVKWMPPEAFLDGIFTSKTDVWSFGVLLWEVMSMGFMPYPGRGNQEVMQLVTAGGRLEPPNSSTPPQVYAIMKQCWLAAPERRPSFSTIIERIGYCLVDPDVVTTKLPTFQKTSLTERDTTVMRPPPDATDYLIPNNPCSNSNYSMSTEKSELLSPDTCSTMTNEETGKLVELEDPLPPNVPPRPGNWNDAKRSADRNNVPKKEMNGNINANTTNDESQNKTVSQAMISENVHHGNQQNVNRYVNVDVNENV